MLGNPENICENFGGKSWRHYYYEAELAFDYDENDSLKFIEFLAGHNGLLKPYIYGVSAFDTKTEELITIISKHNNGIIDERDNESCYFSNIGIGIWKDGANETEDYWTTIGIGYKDYLNR